MEPVILVPFEPSNQKPIMLHVFDLDHTLLKKNSSFHFGIFLFRKREITLIQVLRLTWAYFKHKVFHMSFEKLHSSALEIFLKNTPKKKWESLSHEFSKQYFTDLSYSPVVSRLFKAKESKDEVMLLSSSPDFLVTAFADILGIVTWDATQYLTNNLGIITGIGCVMDGEAKANALKKYLQNHPHTKDHIVVYTDSLHDLPLIRCAGNVIGVGRDRSFIKKCVENHWEVL